MLLNPNDPEELILACQRGLYFAKVCAPSGAPGKLGKKSTSVLNLVTQMAQREQGKAEKAGAKATIELKEERYFEGQGVARVANCNVNQLLVALWDVPGYYKLERATFEHTCTLIGDRTRIEGNFQCTDLVPLGAPSDDQPQFVQYFVARTLAAVNIVDTVRERVYDLERDPGLRQKTATMHVIPRDVPAGAEIGLARQRILF